MAYDFCKLPRKKQLEIIRKVDNTVSKIGNKHWIEAIRKENHLLSLRHDEEKKKAMSERYGLTILQKEIYNTIKSLYIKNSMNPIPIEYIGDYLCLLPYLVDQAIEKLETIKYIDTSKGITPLKDIG